MTLESWYTRGTTNRVGGAVFHSIAKVIDRKTGGLSMSRSVTAAVILAKINSINGGQWEATKFRNGRLAITAPSAIAAQELTWRKTELLKKINFLFDEQIVKDVTIKS